jgi:hypothetical protein
MIMNADLKKKLALLSSYLIVAVAVAVEMERINHEYHEFIQTLIRKHRRKNKFFPRYHAPRLTRKTWDEYSKSINNMTFCQMFRMSKESFQRLCDKICNHIGEEIFRPQSFLQSGTYLPRLMAANDYHGGFISGELKVAIAIRMLGGGSYLDLMFGFSISRSTLYREFDNVISWINECFEFELPGFLHNKDAKSLKSISDGFAEFSGGVFNGIIGALDGIAIRINCPTEADGIVDPGNYWTRKQFYALNVQAICDAKKRFLWVSTGHQVATHDSLAFDGTALNNHLR